MQITKIHNHNPQKGAFFPISISNFLPLLLFLIAACRGNLPQQPNVFDGEQALSFAEKQISFGYRIPGTDAHKKTGDWIITELSHDGWEAQEQFFQYSQFTGRNIIAKRGTMGGKWILLGAHYDTRPQADRDANFPHQPISGANDGASGVAILLELARVIQPEKSDLLLWLVFFDLEDSGGIDDMDWIAGSTYFAGALVDKPDAVVIVDMVGDANLQLYYELNSNPELSAEIWQVAREHGFGSFIEDTKYSLTDDHVPFMQLGIPAVDIIDFDYPYWHTIADTIDKVSAQSLEQVGLTLQFWLEAQ
jgi:glutaminyl-peptide cyclotransferase